MVGEIVFQQTTAYWLNFLIESIKSWILRWSVQKEEENYFLIN